MHWYDGSIAEAVTLSKQRNAIFVVFVEGDNEMSTEMAATIDDAVVLKRLSNQTNFLAIKLMSGSDNYTHFAQIYQFVPVPSLFFIGRNGTPLEVVCAGVQPSSLATRIDRILDEHYKNKPALVKPSTSAQDVKEETAMLLQAEAAKPTPEPKNPTSEDQPETSAGPPSEHKTVVTKSGKEYDVVCEEGFCMRVPKAKADDAGPSQRPDDAVSVTQKEPEDTLNIEDKMERAKELIEIRRKEKADKEKEAEKQKEMERRALGQGVAELKRWQADQELKQIQEERKRERMENEVARQRILEQIAQDRAERRARDAPPTRRPPPADQPPTSGDGGTHARLQFKLPDGSMHTALLDAGGTLADVQRYVADNLQMSASSFSLWTAFPRRELTQTDATLRSLELVPSAALLVLPRRPPPATVATPSSLSLIVAFFTQIFTTYVLDPTQQLYTWLRMRLFNNHPRAAMSPSPPRESTPLPGGDLRDIRRRGNIHRLPGERDKGEDDNNTWNGNSTQQM